MKKQFPHLLSLALTLLLVGCGDGGGGGSGYDPSQPSGQLFIDQPTSEPTYTTYQDSVYLSGYRDPAVSSVTWDNVSTGASGAGGVVDFPDTCCFLFTCWDCIRYLWGATVPLQDSENLIKIYGNGLYADAITVTQAPSLDLSGHVLSNGSGEFNIHLTLTSMTNSASSYSTYTDSAGYYSFRFIPLDSYLLQPEDQNYAFSPCISFAPASFEVTTSGIVDFTSNRTLATISGTVTDAAVGYGIYSAKLTLSSATNPVIKQNFSNPDGYFTFTCVPDGEYGLTPSADPFYNYVGFNPATRAMTITNGVDVSGQDFNGYR